ncbi:arylesterase [Pseudemcibacter sp.]|uniref:arylesterase n=1 Tax=Pseudemcibacter sp. TaxID=2943293 RepID=UPI003F694DE3
MSKLIKLYNNVFITPIELFNHIAIKRLIFTIISIFGSLYVTMQPLHAQETKHILAFGDSLTAGYGLGPGEGFTDQLERTLIDKGINVKVTNAGVSGDTTSGGLSRLEWVLSSAQNVDLVILALGGNDALRGIQPEITRQNMDKMVAILKDKNIPTLIAGMMAPPNLGPIYCNKFNSIYGDMAKKYDVALYPFFLDGVAGFIELNQNDRIHPNPEGVKIITEKMSASITEALK